MGVGFLSMTHAEAIAIKSSRFSVYAILFVYDHG
jgi:hypothetical protein